MNGSRVRALVIMLAAVASACSGSPSPTAATNTVPTTVPTSSASTTAPTKSSSAFSLQSSALTNGGRLPVEYTCDGASANPPISWSGAPAGTVGYAVVMHHVPGPGDVHWYWVVYDLAPTVGHLDAATTPPGRVGTNSVNNRNAYAPPCSQGPGDKTYTITVYALAQQPTFADRAAVSRQVLLDAISGHVLAEASIDVVYARPASATSGPTPPKATGSGGAPR